MGQIIPVKNNIFRKSAEYTIFWGVSLVFLAHYFSLSGRIEPIDWIYTLLFHISIWFCVVVNSFLLIPRLLAGKRWILYVFLLFLLLETGILLNQFTFRYLADLLFPGYFFISYYERTDLYYFIGGYVGVTSLIQFSRSWFTESETRQRLTEMEKARTEQELNVLKMQIQPHFLFNSLNTIYALCRKSSPIAAQAVLKLSDLLRYTIRQTEATLVPLSDEVDYLNRYIDLQKMRLNHPDLVQFEADLANPEMQVIPLLFIGFIENGFKYADFESGEPFVIALSSEGGTIRFRCSNKVREAGPASETPDGTGTGNSNLSRRLELHYPGKHQLEIGSDGTHFTVNLEIQTL